MRCKCCGDTVRCGSCGVKVNSAQTVWARRLQRNGRCPRCGRKKEPRDRMYVNCFDCRKKNSDRMKQQYAIHGRKDRRRAA